MRMRLISVVLMVGVLLAACGTPSAAPLVPTRPPNTLPAQSISPLPAQPLSPLAAPGKVLGGDPVENARADVAQRQNVPVSDVKVISSEPVDWSDACLGIQQPNVMCAQVITPGYKVVLEVNGKQYEYHTNASGSAVRLASEP